MLKNLRFLFSFLMLSVMLCNALYDMGLSYQSDSMELVDDFEKESKDDSENEKEEKTEKKESEEDLNLLEYQHLTLKALSSFSAKTAETAVHFADNLTNVILELETPPPEYLS